MSGHGWVTPNPDGSVARCGGPGICPQCSKEAGKTMVFTKDAERSLEPPPSVDPTERLRIAMDALVEIRNLDRSTWKPEAVKAHEALTRLGWRP